MHSRTIESFSPSQNALKSKGVYMKTFALLFALTFAAVPQLHAATSALDEVNAVRVKRGLPKFVFDEKLTEAAEKCADYRAEHLISGHTSNDFAFVPAGASASAAGCAAWSPEEGWGACCTYENFQVAGAAWSKGRDGRRYMHLFVRGGNGGGDSGSSATTSSGRGRRGRR